jgi:hypothetical protein
MVCRKDTSAKVDYLSQGRTVRSVARYYGRKGIQDCSQLALICAFWTLAWRHFVPHDLCFHLHPKHNMQENMRPLLVLLILQSQVSGNLEAQGMLDLETHQKGCHII